MNIEYLFFYALIATGAVCWWYSLRLAYDSTDVSADLSLYVYMVLLFAQGLFMFAEAYYRSPYSVVMK
jgi:hypothetical protein